MGQLIFNESAKIIKWRKNSLFKKMILEQLNTHIQKTKTPDRYLTPYRKIHSTDSAS